MKQILGVRFSKTGKLYYMDAKEYSVKVGDVVIAESERGLELARVVSLHDIETISEVENIEIRTIERLATKADIEKQKKLDVDAKKVLETCKRLAKKHGLEMKFINAAYTFDETKLICYWTHLGDLEVADAHQLILNLCGLLLELLLVW